MYKEKVVASFVVAVLCDQRLKQDEVDVLKALCARDFHSNNPFITRVAEMIQDANESGIDVAGEEFRDKVYNYLVSEITDKDPYLRVATKESDVLHGLIEVADALDELEAARKSAASAVDFLEQSVTELRELQTPKHVIYYMIFGDDVFVTENFNEQYTSAVMSTQDFTRFAEFVIRRGNATLIEK